MILAVSKGSNMLTSRCFALLLCGVLTSGLCANDIRGTYVEARNCQVYTGPCFANGEVGLMGKRAVMAWQVESGTHDGVKLDGLGVAMIVKASHTLAFKGLRDAKLKQSVIVVDRQANSKQRAALRAFALAQTGMPAKEVVSVKDENIDLNFDVTSLTATLKVGNIVKLKTRKARPSDCICSNESAYYPPLVSLQGSVPGVTIEGDVTARALSTRWSIPDTRSAYMGVFDTKQATLKLASR